MVCCLRVVCSILGGLFCDTLVLSKYIYTTFCVFSVVDRLVDRLGGCFDGSISTSTTSTTRLPL
jgi:hypothetical protein